MKGLLVKDSSTTTKSLPRDPSAPSAPKQISRLLPPSETRTNLHRRRAARRCWISRLSPRYILLLLEVDNACKEQEDEMAMDGGAGELQCVGKLEIANPKPVGFLCGTLPVPTDSTFPLFQSALLPSPHVYALPALSLCLSPLSPVFVLWFSPGWCRIGAPRYQMLPAETDLNTLPILSNLPEKVFPSAAKINEGSLSCLSLILFTRKTLFEENGWVEFILRLPQALAGNKPDFYVYPRALFIHLISSFSPFQQRWCKSDSYVYPRYLFILWSPFLIPSNKSDVIREGNQAAKSFNNCSFWHIPSQIWLDDYPIMLSWFAFWYALLMKLLRSLRNW